MFFPELYFLDNSDSDFDSNFPDQFENIIYCSKGDSASDYEGYSYVSNFSIKVMLDGVQEYNVDGEKKRLVSGQSLLINNGSDTVFLNEYGKAISIFLEPELIHEVQGELVSKNITLDRFDDVSLLKYGFYDGILNHQYNFIKKISNQVQYQDLWLVSQDFYYEIAEEVIQFNCDCFNRLNTLSEVKFSTRKELFRRVHFAREMILQSLKEPFVLDEVARASCLSKYQLIRVFRSVYNITPHKFYVREKIKSIYNEFKQDRSNKRLIDFAREYNYSEYATFCKQFKAILGYPPSFLRSQDK